MKYLSKEQYEIETLEKRRYNRLQAQLLEFMQSDAYAMKLNWCELGYKSSNSCASCWLGSAKTLHIEITTRAVEDCVYILKK